jgi:tRNA dimethylallyltransferase
MSDDHNNKPAEGGLGGDRKAPHPKLIVIEGTNASGKSSLGISLAARFGGEIVSADSRQVYRRLDLGSGKVTPEEMNGVPHHLLDVRDPGEFFSMADFQRLAYEAIDWILARGAVPFLVGGTGLYVDAVADGYELSDISPDHDLRAHLETFDTPALYKMLKEKLPDTEIDPRNRHRVMRALERLEADDYRPGKKSPRYELLKLGVTWSREILKQRIDERLERRLREGMVDEVRAMLDDGVSEEFLVKLGLEYKYLTWYLTGKIGYEQMVEELGNAIKKFAKRQMTWFRRDPRIHWLDMSKDPVAEATGLIEGFMLSES